MSATISLKEAKAQLSDIIDRIIYNKEKFYISKKGKNVAVIAPLEEPEEKHQEGLILAQRGLAEFEKEIDEMEECIYKAREEEVSREVLF